MSSHLEIVDIIDDTECLKIYKQADEFRRNTLHDWVWAILSKCKDYQKNPTDATAARVLDSVLHMSLARRLAS